MYICDCGGGDARQQVLSRCKFNINCLFQNCVQCFEHSQFLYQCAWLPACGRTRSHRLCVYIFNAPIFSRTHISIIFIHRTRLWNASLLPPETTTTTFSKYTNTQSVSEQKRKNSMRACLLVYVRMLQIVQPSVVLTVHALSSLDSRKIHCTWDSAE